MNSEMAELQRQMALRVLENHRMGRVIDAQILESARKVIEKTKPLGRMVGPGKKDKQ